VKRLAILGSTGSIGTSALAVVDAHPDRLSVVTMAAGENVALLSEQIARYRPALVGVGSDKARDALTRHLAEVDGRTVGSRPVIAAGVDALVAAATHPDVDIVLCASSGTAGLEAALAAIDAGKTLALANKEVLVMAGALMVDAARRRDSAGRQRAQRHSPVSARTSCRRRAPVDSDRVRRTVSSAGRRRADAGHAA
jgi:1-deoxy-D-xylulose-5-phosphate reductoisomerase